MQMQTYQFHAFLSEPFPTPPDFFCCTTLHGVTDAGPQLCILSRKTALAVQQDKSFVAVLQQLEQTDRLKIAVVDEPLSFEEWRAFAWDEMHASGVFTQLLAVKKFDHRLVLLNATRTEGNDPKCIARAASATGRDYPEEPVSEICAHCYDILTGRFDHDYGAIRTDLLTPHSGFR
jgi:hypothetical protein